MDIRERHPSKFSASCGLEERSIYSGRSPVDWILGIMNCSRSNRVRAALWRWRRTELVVAVIIAIFVIAAQIRPPCLWSYLVLKRYPKLGDGERTDVTLVSAYFNLGQLEKGRHSLTTYNYLHWAEAFQYVLNPLVVYTDSEQIENLLLETRKHLANRTHVVRITRSSLDSFHDVEHIRALFQDPNYPKFYPNTVIPEYPCSQHAKYELVERTLNQRPLPNTRYIAWIDIGYFRYNTKRRRPFFITPPPGMDDSKIAMTELSHPDFSLHPSDVFRNNLVWVGGGMSLATREVYRKFAEEYREASQTFLKQGLSSTDQQVIYAMFTRVHQGLYRPQTRIQTYSWVLRDVRSCWFYLGYLCYREA